MKSRTIFAVVTGLCMTAAFAGPGMEADTDQDGLISMSEFKAMHDARVEKRFAHLDTDADGYINADELQAAPRRSHDKRGNPGHRRDRNPEKAFERLDADDSGGVSQQELEGKRFTPDADAFHAADTDGSGELDAAELHAMKQAHKAERRAADRGSED